MIKIKKARTKDFMSIARLDTVIWNQENVDRSFMVDGEHIWKKWVEYALVFCAKNPQGLIVGAVVAFPTIKNGWCIHKLFVVEEYRQDGIGHALISRVLEEIDRQESKVFLSVSPENTGAIKLYQRLGFVKVELHKGYYREDEHRFIMVRPVQWADMGAISQISEFKAAYA